jgi:hypothetical protein
VANVTAASAELLSELQGRSAAGPASFTLVVPSKPVKGGREAATLALQEAIEAMQAAGLQVEGHVGNPDPIVAVSDAWDPRRYDEIIVSTLPLHASKWLHAGLPERIGRLTGARVTNVVATPVKPPVSGHPAPVREKLGVMAPLSVMTWGGHQGR